MRKWFLIFVLLTATGPLWAQGYEIKLQLTGATDTLILGHYYASQRVIYVDTVVLDKTGSGVLKGPKPLPGGMYFIIFNKTYYDLIIDKEQFFTLTANTADFLNTVKSKGSNEAQVFFDFVAFRSQRFEKIKSLDTERNATTDANRKKELGDQISALNQELNAERDRIMTSWPDAFFSRFLKSTTDPEVPQSFIEDNRIKDDKVPDYLSWYWRSYWQNFDYADPRLFRAPLYEEKLKKYLEEVLPAIPDTIIPVMDEFLTRVKNSNDEEFFKYVLVTIFNHYASSQLMGMDAVYVYVAEKFYIPYATWSSPSFINKTKENVRKKKPTLIGAVASPMNLQTVPSDPQVIEQLITSLDGLKQRGMPVYDDYKVKLKALKSVTNSDKRKQDSLDLGLKTRTQLVPFVEDFGLGMDGRVSLHDIKARYTLVWFWTPDCSHCKKATPELKEMYDKLRPLGFEVYAVFLEHVSEDWTKYIGLIKEWYELINTHKLYQWVNAWDPVHESMFRNNYDIYSSPVPYLLDKDKKIIAKRISVASIEDVIMQKELEEIKKTAQGKDREDKIKAMIKGNYTLRDLDAIKKNLLMVFGKTEGESYVPIIEKAEQLVKLAMDQRVSSIRKAATPEARIDGMKQYANSLWNKDDLTYLKEHAEKVFTGEEKDKIVKQIEERIKYELE